MGYGLRTISRPQLGWRRCGLVALAVALVAPWLSAAAQESTPTDLAREAAADVADPLAGSPDPATLRDLRSAQAALDAAERAIARGTLSVTDLRLAVERIGTAIPLLSSRHSEAASVRDDATREAGDLAALHYRLGRHPDRALGALVGLDAQYAHRRMSILLGAAAQERQSTSHAAGQTAATAASQLTEAQHAIEDIARLLEFRIVELETARRDAPALAATVAALNAAAAAQRRLGTVGASDLPYVALDAYMRAAGQATTDTPTCGLDWPTLAAIGRIESSHGTYGGSRLLPDGTTETPIIGRPLDGSDNTRHIADSDAGLLDGDPVYDRAVGPMQFIPSTWRRWSRDGDLDGTADIHNIYDAAAGAAAYLCSSGTMTTTPGQRARLLAYNRSGAYVDRVIELADGYRALDLPRR